MKVLVIVLAAALVAAAPAAAIAATASDARASGSCYNWIRTPTQCAIWVLKCVGDSLGGNACHEDAPVTVASTDAKPDVEAILACAGVAVQSILDGTTPEMCPIGRTAVAEGDGVGCAKAQTRQVVAGVAPLPCVA